jgi:signal transduction histidine kinase
MLALGIIPFSMNGWGQQSPNWRVYGTSDGLPELSCRFLSIGGAGDLLVRGSKQSAITKFDGYTWSNPEGPDSSSYSPTGRVFESPAGQLWMVYSGGLCRFSYGVWITQPIPEIAALNTGDFAVQAVPIRQDEVLFLLPDQLMEFSAEQPNSIRTIRRAAQTSLGRFTGLKMDPDDNLWISGERGLAEIPGPKRTITDKTEWKQFVLPDTIQADALSEPQCNSDGSITCLARQKTNALVVRFEAGQWKAIPAPSNIRFTWEGSDTTIWAATSDSLLRFTDGKFVADEEISLGTIFDVAVGAHGMFWLGTSEGLFCRIPKLWRSNAAAPQSLFSSTTVNKSLNIPPNATAKDVIATITLTDGKTWCATHEEIWSFNGKNWSTVRSGLGTISAMIQAPDGIWVSSGQGVHRYVQGNWFDMGTDESLSSPSILNIEADSTGHVWAQTSRGVDEYEPEVDSDRPSVEILSPLQEKRSFPEWGAVTINFSGHDKWNVTPKTRLLYSWRLDDSEWSPFGSSASATFADLVPGKHYFQIRSADRNANITPKPARMEFAVILPWYREARSLWFGIFGAAIAIFFAGLALKRHRQLVHSYARVEQQIVERTRELQIANEELLQSQKMKALGTLAAGIAHDFNNILSIVKGSVQIIEDNIGDTQKIRTRTNRIKTVVDQGTSVVQALLGFSRNSDELLEPCDINAVVENTIRLFGDRFLREVNVRFDPAFGLHEVRVSKTLVQQILLNFVFNAAEAMTGPKEVIISTSESAFLPAGVALSPEPALGYVLVSVRDSGCGIPLEIIPRVFEPFFTTKALSARRGTGLGLSVAYELARKMKAGLAVQSTVGKGSVFTLVLPIAAAPATVSQKSSP